MRSVSFLPTKITSIFPSQADELACRPHHTCFSALKNIYAWGGARSNCPWARQMILAAASCFAQSTSPFCICKCHTRDHAENEDSLFTVGHLWSGGQHRAERRFIFEESERKKASVISAACTRLMTARGAARERWQKQLSPMIRRLINNYVALDAAARGHFSICRHRALPTNWDEPPDDGDAFCALKCARGDSWAHSPNLEIHLLEKCFLGREAEKTLCMSVFAT